jgi:nucleotide-binding universal stress UspA family protein
MDAIVVGVDHSEGAKDALRFALAEAKLRGATLRAVHVWQMQPRIPGIEAALDPLGAELDEWRRSAEAALEETLAEVGADAAGVDVERRVLEGAPGAVLVAESRDADLLVVGSRGHGGFAELLLGSVGQQVAHHADCPVVIVRPKRTAG